LFSSTWPFIPDEQSRTASGLPVSNALLMSASSSRPVLILTEPRA
jgi:hypothetical protein